MEGDDDEEELKYKYLFLFTKVKDLLLKRLVLAGSSLPPPCGPLPPLLGKTPKVLLALKSLLGAGPLNSLLPTCAAGGGSAGVPGA